MKGETEQSLLAAGNNLRADVEEHRRGGRARLQHLDDARLLDDEQTVQAVAGVADEHRTREA